jgi:hypothetical protein
LTIPSAIGRIPETGTAASGFLADVCGGGHVQLFRVISLATLTFVLAGCWWDDAPADVKALDRVSSELESGSVLHDPTGVRSDLSTIIAGKQDDFSNDQWQRVLAYNSMQSQIQSWHISATATIESQALIISSQATSFGGTFKEKLGGITQEAIKGYACAQIRNFAFPDSSASANSADASWSEPEGEFITAAENELAKSFHYSYNIVAWVNWYDNVAQTGQQIAQALDSSPATYASLLAKPGVRRAAVAYVQYCLSPSQ